MTGGKSRRGLLQAAGSVGVATLAGCIGGEGVGSATSDPGGLDRTMKLATVFALSSRSADLGGAGEDRRLAANLPVEQIRGADLGLEVEVENRDTETVETVGVRHAAELADRGYPMVVGANVSSVTLQMANQVLIPQRIVGCSPSSTSPTISMLNDRGMVFRVAITDALQSRLLASLAAEEYGGDRVAIVHLNNDYGLQLSEAFTATYRGEYDGTVTAQVPFEPGGESYAAELDRVRRSDPDLLVVVAYTDSGVQILSDYYEDPFADGVLVTDGLRSDILPDEVGHSLETVRGTAPETGGPGRDAFRSLYEDEHGKNPLDTSFTAQTYDAAAVMLLANAFAGENDGVAVRNAMRQVANPGGDVVTPDNFVEGIRTAARGEPVQYRGASSNVVFDETGDMASSEFEVWSFDGDGELVTEERRSL